LPVSKSQYLHRHKHWKIRKRANNGGKDLIAYSLTSIGDGVIATDSKAKVTLLNPVAERLTGWSHSDALGRDISEILKIINQETKRPVTIPIISALSHGTVQGLSVCPTFPLLQ
jgi:PAS domain-containing protein